MKPAAPLRECHSVPLYPALAYLRVVRCMRLSSRFLAPLLLFFAISTALCESPRYRALLAQAKRTIVHGRQPDYPIDARSRHITAAGLFQLRIRVNTRRVIDVEVVKSTGHSVLDAAAMDTSNT